jgi:hypothetical protein
MTSTSEMHLRFAALCGAVLACIGSAALAQDTASSTSARSSNAVERSSLFAMAAGDTIIDSGMMVVATGRGARSEAFEVVRRKDGGRTMTSVIRGKDNAYRV